MSNFLAMPVFLFTIYAFLGWLLENSYNLITKHRFIKPNFIKGPFKPMYGLAPIFLVYFIAPDTHWAVVICLCLIIPTIIEYISGAMLQQLTNRKWWNYSNIPFQLHGHICLSYSLCWLGLSLLCINVLHPAIVSIFHTIEPIWNPIWPIIYIYFMLELMIAMRRHSYQTHTEIKTSRQV
jgi:uncharacterized membrane protein